MNDDIQEKKPEETVSEQESDANIDELQKKLADSEDKYKRALADYVNLQRRNDEQRVRWIGEANKGLLLKLLPVFDTLMLAYKHTQDKGLELSIDQFLTILESEGVIKIKTVGEHFDPHTMECITTQPGEEGEVLEEVRTGFMLHDMILRTAQVIVGKKEA